MGGVGKQAHHPLSRPQQHSHASAGMAMHSTTAPGAAACHALTLPRTVMHTAALHARGAALDADAITGAAGDVAVLQDGAAALRKHSGAACKLMHRSRESAGGVCKTTHNAS